MLVLAAARWCSHFFLFSFTWFRNLFLPTSHLSKTSNPPNLLTPTREVANTTILLCWLQNREIYITGTAPYSTGTGYSTTVDDGA